MNKRYFTNEVFCLGWGEKTSPREGVNGNSMVWRWRGGFFSFGHLSQLPNLGGKIQPARIGVCDSCFVEKV